VTKFKILLIGDSCIDVYQYGTVERISPEAPVPIFKYVNAASKPGMAANVLSNLKNLNCTVDFFECHVGYKTRLIDQRSGQHIVRIDQDIIGEPIQFDKDWLNTHYDAVVVSDYNKGGVDYQLLDDIQNNFDCPIFVDTKKQDLARLEKCIVKINNIEFESSVSKCSKLIVTQGANGALYKNQHFPTEYIQVVDVCGAGDTFLSALTYGYLESYNMTSAIRFAIRASAITIQHLGVYAPLLEEICD
jgi:D-beta-D-heptose 7-phosphate kinase/D-beta-D-heptose 1-phosphate adenosyltransferase